MTQGFAPLVAWRRHLPLLLVMLVGVLCYGHTLQAPFYLDDAGSIYNSKVVVDLGRAIAEVLAQRGLATLTFAVNYHFGALNLVGYHLVNIAIHLCAACVVLLLLRRLFPGAWLPQLFGALVFVAHPLQTQAVTYLAQRMTSLSALLLLLAMYLFVLARESLVADSQFADRRHLVYYCGSLLAGAAAILAKENAVILPVALWAYTWLWDPDQLADRRAFLGYLAPFMIAPVLAVIGYLLVPNLAPTPFDTLGYSKLLRSMEGNTPLNYLATQCKVLWIYLRMLVLPYGQALDHGYPVVRDWLNVKTLAGAGGLAALAWTGWRLRRRARFVTFAIAWFFLTLAIESSVIPLDPLFEHRLYLPMFGVATLAGGLLMCLREPSWQLWVVGAVLLPLCVLTWQRNSLWNDPIAFYEDNLKVAPDNERVYFNLSQEYLQAGDYGRGEYLVRESIAMNPSRHFGYASLKELYVAQERLDEAVSMLQYGLEHVDPRYRGQLLNDLAFVYGKQGDFIRAIEVLHQAIAENPKLPEVYFNLAQMQLFAGQTGQVESNLRKVLELEPGHADARQMLDRLMNGARWSSSFGVR